MPPKLHQLQNVSAHEGKINSMCLGHRTVQVFATGGEDRFLKIWSIGSNNPRSSFGPFQSPITACRFNSAEDMIVCANNSGTVMLFDLNENLCSSNWTSHHSAVRCLSFHTHDPRLILTCGVDGKFNVLSTTQRTPIQSYNAHNGPINYISCSPDGNVVATCGDDKTIRVFDIGEQKLLFKFDNAHTDSISCVQFHPTDPLLISCGADRSIKFWDLQNQQEIATSFALDSSPVDVVMFVPYPTPSTYNAAISASADYIKVVGWKPPEVYDNFALGLELVHDIAIDYNSTDEGTLTIASSSDDIALIYRMLLSQLKPFSNRQLQSPQFDLPNTSEPEKQKSTPRLLDLTTMTKVKSKTKVTQPTSTKTTTTTTKRVKANVASSSSAGSTASSSINSKVKTNTSARSSGRSSNKSNRSISSGSKKMASTEENNGETIERRSNSSGSRVSRNSSKSEGSTTTAKRTGGTKPSYASDTSEELKIFRDFRKYRGPFITQMNERYARLNRVKDSIVQIGLVKTLENAVETGELGSELLNILGMKPEVVKLEHAALMMQISVKVFDRDYDLAIITVESMLQSFGKLVNVTRQTALNGVGSDYALEERKKKSDMFVDGFREIAPKMRTVACGKSQISQTAAEILEQWKFFLR